MQAIQYLLDFATHLPADITALCALLVAIGSLLVAAQVVCHGGASLVRRALDWNPSQAWIVRIVAVSSWLDRTGEGCAKLSTDIRWLAGNLAAAAVWLAGVLPGVRGKASVQIKGPGVGPLVVLAAGLMAMSLTACTATLEEARLAGVRVGHPGFVQGIRPEVCTALSDAERGWRQAAIASGSTSGALATVAAAIPQQSPDERRARVGLAISAAVAAGVAAVGIAEAGELRAEWQQGGCGQ